MLQFGVLVVLLEFLVATVQAAFPDCFAKRRNGPGRWERVRMEFEFKSRVFRDHDPAGYDTFVYRDHNWPDCPVEVLGLKTAVARARNACCGCASASA